MEQVPKIVSQRLQAVSRTETHPDANLLAAFAEKSLLPKEQTQILEHLAACAECREVVAHAQPEEVLHRVAVAAAAPMPRGSWLSGVTVRWVALAAWVWGCGSVVISRTQFARQSGHIATYIGKPDVVAKTEPQLQSVPGAPSEEKDAMLGKPGRLKTVPEVATKRDADQLSELKK